ncbi:MAG TPA: DALR domain-containing protein, partial [Phycisphaerae bacterium]|nr:DALR domain-containing protein [Phycisphaerae bacterium]
EFNRAMDDDLNIAGAMGALFTWAGPLFKQKKFSCPQARSALWCLKRVDHVLGVIFSPLRVLPAEKKQRVEALMNQRDAVRQKKDYAASDELRKELLKLGVEVKDSPAGSTWRPLLAPMQN